MKVGENNEMRDDEGKEEERSIKELTELID